MRTYSGFSAQATGLWNDVILGAPTLLFSSVTAPLVRKDVKLIVPTRASTTTGLWVLEYIELSVQICGMNSASPEWRHTSTIQTTRLRRCYTVRSISGPSLSLTKTTTKPCPKSTLKHIYDHDRDRIEKKPAMTARYNGGQLQDWNSVELNELPGLRWQLTGFTTNHVARLPWSTVNVD